MQKMLSQGSSKISSLIHCKGKPHVCNICQKSFFQEEDLKEHSLIHSGGKPHVCNICKKAFSRNGNLLRHSLIHSGEKPYLCNICQSSFTRKSDLKIHFRIHSGEKPYVCNICQKSFSQKSNLTKHSLIHGGKKTHKFNIYLISFARKRHLTNHSLIHNSEKHQCNICQKSFSRNADLKTHFLNHGGDIPFECNICNKLITSEKHRHLLPSTGNNDNHYTCGSCYSDFQKNSVSHNDQCGVKSDSDSPNCNIEEIYFHTIKEHDKDYNEEISHDCKKEIDINKLTKSDDDFIYDDVKEEQNIKYSPKYNKEIKDEINDDIIKEEHDIDYEDGISHEYMRERNNTTHSKWDDNLCDDVKEEENLMYSNIIYCDELEETDIDTKDIYI